MNNITKSEVLTALTNHGITTRLAALDLIAENRGLDNTGNTTMRAILAEFKASRVVGWVSRRRIRHFTKVLIAEGVLA